MSTPTNSNPTPLSGMPVITVRHQEPVGRHRVVEGVTLAQHRASYLVKSRQAVAR